MLTVLGTVRAIAHDSSVHTVCTEGADLAELLACKARCLVTFGDAELESFLDG
jgi:hypothetical protein